MQTAIRTHSTDRNLPCCAKYVLQVSQMMFETSAIDLCTGRFRVWMYWIQPHTVPPTHTRRPIIRTADPRSAPPMNETVCRSGILMSDSLARTDGMMDAASAAAVANCHALGNFMLKARGL